MTNAVPIRIADAVTAEINGHTFAIGEFTATRSYADWDEDFKDIQENKPTVDVVFRATTAPELDDRNSLEYVVEIDIAVRQRFGSTARTSENGRLKNAAVDPLVKLLEEIHEYFVSERGSTPLEAESDAYWQSSDVKLWCDHRKLRAGLFYGWVRVTFSISKDI